MKKIAIFPAILTVLIYVVCLNAQNLDWNITGAGARAGGLGGAFIGVADDATAVVWNPSGLAYLERPEASIVTKFLHDSYKVDITDRYSSDESQSHFVLNFLSGAYPFELAGRKVVAALAFQKQLDFFSYNDSEFTKQEISGGANTLTPGIGVQITPLISAGLSTNIWMGKAKQEYTDKNFPEYSYDTESSFSGFNFVLGAMADLSNLQNSLPLKIGASVRTPFELDKEEDGNNATIEIPFMFGIGASYRLGEFLTFALDLETRAYGNSKIKPEGAQDFNVSPSEKNLNQLRAGAEYLLVTDFAVLPLRIGIQTVPTVYANYDNSNQPEDQVKGFGFAIGSGLIMERYALDITYTHSGFEQKNDAASLTVNHGSNIINLSGILYF